MRLDPWIKCDYLGKTTPGLKAAPSDRRLLLGRNDRVGRMLFASTESWQVGRPLRVLAGEWFVSTA